MPNCNVLQEISNLRDKCILRLKWEEKEEGRRSSSGTRFSFPSHIKKKGQIVVCVHRNSHFPTNATSLFHVIKRRTVTKTLHRSTACADTNIHVTRDIETETSNWNGSFQIRRENKILPIPSHCSAQKRLDFIILSNQFVLKNTKCYFLKPLKS